MEGVGAGAGAGAGAGEEERQPFDNRKVLRGRSYWVRVKVRVLG